MRNLYIIFFSLATSFSYGQQINSITTLSTPNCNGPGAFEQVELDLSGLDPNINYEVIAYTGSTFVGLATSVAVSSNGTATLHIQILIKRGYVNLFKDKVPALQTYWSRGWN